MTVIDEKFLQKQCSALLSESKMWLGMAILFALILFFCSDQANFFGIVIILFTIIWMIYEFLKSMKKHSSESDAIKKGLYQIEYAICSYIENNDSTDVELSFINGEKIKTKLDPVTYKMTNQGDLFYVISSTTTGKVIGSYSCRIYKLSDEVKKKMTGPKPDVKIEKAVDAEDVKQTTGNETSDVEQEIKQYIAHMREPKEHTPETQLKKRRPVASSKKEVIDKNSFYRFVEREENKLVIASVSAFFICPVAITISVIGDFYSFTFGACVVFLLMLVLFVNSLYKYISTKRSFESENYTIEYIKCVDKETESDTEGDASYYISYSYNDGRVVKTISTGEQYNMTDKGDLIYLITCNENNKIWGKYNSHTFKLSKELEKKLINPEWANEKEKEQSPAEKKVVTKTDKAEQENEKEKIYKQALGLMQPKDGRENEQIVNSLKAAISKFESIHPYKNTFAQIENCKSQIYDIAGKMAKKEDTRYNAIRAFDYLGEFKGAAKRKEKLEKKL